MKTRLDLAQAARWFHALSDETRLEIVRMLGDGERCVCDLTDALGAAQSRLSFHLKTLKVAGIVTDRKQGRWIYYALNPDVLDAIAEFAAEAKPPEQAWRVESRCCG